jgi:hypothetical protein
MGMEPDRPGGTDRPVVAFTTIYGLGVPAVEGTRSTSTCWQVSSPSYQDIVDNS